MFCEADDKEEEEEQVIKLKASDKRRVDYTKGADLEDPDPVLDDSDYEDTPDEDETSEEDVPDEPIEDDTDYSEDDTENDSTGEEPVGDTDTADDTETPEEPITDDSDYTDEDTGEDTGEEGDTTDGPITDDTDYTDDGSGDDSAEDSGEDTEAPQGDDDGKPTGSALEQSQKYILYKKFLKLDENLTMYIKTLNDIITDDAVIMMKYQTVGKNLEKAKNLLSEYMLIKYQSSTYIQNMLFFKRIIAIVDISFNMIAEIKGEKEKNMKKKK